MNDNLVSRIQKLLALTSSSYEAEAQAALLKAQALMEEHGISMENVQSANQNTIDGVMEEAVNKKSNQIATWERILTRVVVKNFRCKVFWRSNRQHKRTIMIYGMEDDVKVAKEVLEFALQSARNCWTKYYNNRKQKEGPFPSRQHTEAVKNDYMKAFARGVDEAFKQQVQEKSIVLDIDPRVNRYAQTQLNLSTEASRKHAVMNDADATANGFTDGQRIRGGDKIANSYKRITAGA